MPYLLEDLIVNRVDFVDEGANSAAFIELYKRKEPNVIMDVKEIISKMKPEHAAVVQAELDRLSGEVTKANETLDVTAQDLEKAKEDLNTVTADLEKANSEIETLKAKQPCECDGEADDKGICKSCGKPKKSANFDETETLKSMPESARQMFAKMKAQKEAAEEEVRKAKEAEKNAEAVAKAAELKALPLQTDKLVDVLKRCDSEMVEVLTTINAAIEGTVLDEVGKSHTGGSTADAWTKIETKADEIAKRDNVTKQKAVSIAIKENPELYKEYLQGGAN